MRLERDATCAPLGNRGLCGPLCNVYYMPIVANRNQSSPSVPGGSTLPTLPYGKRPGKGPWVRPLLAAAVIGVSAATATAAQPPFVRLLAQPGAVVAPASCEPNGATPVITARFDLGSEGSYRYSPAYVIPYFFDDEGEFNLVWNQDATLYVSGYARVPGVRTQALPLVPLRVWYAGFDRLPDHTELAMRVAAYDATGKPVSTARVTWDCTTGVVRSLEHRGNAADPDPSVVTAVEYYHAGLDHYFTSADPAEIAALDAGVHAGWRRTGETLRIDAARVADTSGVCRFYLPPAFGDSHFYSASPAECADVRARFPGFVLESEAVFAAALPEPGSGACAPGLVPVFRLWNGRADTNHRYTTSAALRAAMVARGAVSEGYGPAGVAFCALP